MSITPTLFSKQDLIKKFKEIKSKGWVKSKRSPGNAGAVGNTLEDLLGIEENNLPIPNAAEWELKAQRKNTASLTTLFHMEPSPIATRIVVNILLPLYGWTHREAGNRYAVAEMSFRSTTPGNRYTDRGFKIVVDYKEKKVKLTFQADKVDLSRHKLWLNDVKNRVGLGGINPQPYWGFDDLQYKAGSKLKNTFFALADSKIENGIEYFRFGDVFVLTKFSFNNFLKCIENGIILIDFDARSGHNHGTKFRIQQNSWLKLFSSVKKVV